MTGTGIHALDAMVRMAGPVRRVQALLLSHRPAPDPLDTISVLLEFRSGVSGMLAAVRSTPAFWRVHVFGRDGSAEALGRTELVLRRSGKEPQRLAFPEIDSVRANLEAFANAVAGKPMRLLVQAVGPRVTHQYDRRWEPGEVRAGHLVVIGLKGIDRAAIGRALADG